MKITKELSDTKFEIELESQDFEKSSDRINLVVAHDYVQFSGYEWVHTKSECPPLKSEHRICANVIPIVSTVQIPIRAFVDVILPKLNDHIYCKPDHLIGGTGKSEYITTTSVSYYKDGVKMIAIPEGDKYYHIPYDLYIKIKEGNE